MTYINRWQFFTDRNSFHIFAIDSIAEFSLNDFIRFNILEILYQLVYHSEILYVDALGLTTGLVLVERTCVCQQKNQ